MYNSHSLLVRYLLRICFTSNGPEDEHESEGEEGHAENQEGASLQLEPTSPETHDDEREATVLALGWASTP